MKGTFTSISFQYIVIIYLSTRLCRRIVKLTEDEIMEMYTNIAHVLDVQDGKAQLEKNIYSDQKRVAKSGLSLVALTPQGKGLASSVYTNLLDKLTTFDYEKAYAR